jgi:hypothetical protein
MGVCEVFFVCHTFGMQESAVQEKFLRRAEIFLAPCNDCPDDMLSWTK